MEHIKNAIRSARKLNGEIIGITRERNETALYQCYVARADEYVVWGYNARMDGFYNGYYTTDAFDAQTEYKRRINKYC